MYQWKLFSIFKLHVIFPLMMNWKNKVICDYIKIGVKNNHSSYLTLIQECQTHFHRGHLSLTVAFKGPESF